MPSFSPSQRLSSRNSLIFLDRYSWLHSGASDRRRPSIRVCCLVLQDARAANDGELVLALSLAAWDANRASRVAMPVGTVSYKRP